jgi:hypothetical protein
MFANLNDLQFQHEVLALEALAVHRPNIGMVEKLGTMVDSVSNQIADSLRGLILPVGAIDFVPALREVQKHKYVDLSPVQLPIPAGLSAPLVPYGQLLLRAQELSMSILDDTLEPFQKFVGEALNNPEKLGSSVLRAQNHPKEIKDLQNKLKDVFRNGTKATRPYSEVIRNNNDWVELKDICTTLKRNADRQSPKDFADTVTELDQQLRTLIKRIRDTNEQYRPSPEVVKQLADLSYTLAEQVSFYSVVNTLIASYLKAVEDAVDVIKKL